MILLDSSAWVEFDRATGSDTDTRVASLIADGAPVACTEPALMEVLARARDPVAVTTLRRLLTSFEWIPADAQTDPKRPLGSTASAAPEG